MHSLAIKEKKPLDFNLINQMCDIAFKSKCYGHITKEAMLNLCITAYDLDIPFSKVLNKGIHVSPQGALIMSAQLMNDMIRRAGNSIQIDSSEERCIIIARRKDNGDVLRFEYNMKDAERAELNKSSTWKKHPKSMLYNRCMTSVGRMLFSDVVGNAYCEDEGYEIAKIPPHKTPDIDPFSSETIDVFADIPKISDQTKEKISVEDIQKEFEINGLECELDHLKKYIFHTASIHKKSQDFIIDQAMESKDRLNMFQQCYCVWRDSQKNDSEIKH